MGDADSKRTTQSIQIYAVRALIVHGWLHLRKEDLVDRDKDELDEEANQAHGQETNQRGQADLLELCGITAAEYVNKCNMRKIA